MKKTIFCPYCAGEMELVDEIEMAREQGKGDGHFAYCECVNCASRSPRETSREAALKQAFVFCQKINDIPEDAEP